MTDNVTGLAVDYDQPRFRNVVPFPKQYKDDAYSFDATSIAGAEYVPSGDLERRKPIIKPKYDLYDQSYVTVQATSRELLSNAFERITDVIDFTLSQAQRSNSFDEWKDLLKHIARKAEHLGSSHRKVLGSLISSTAHKDVSDFSSQSIKILIQCMNILRQPRVTKPEARQAITSLLSNKIDPLIPLVPDNADGHLLTELDDMMNNLLAEDQKVNA
jgi:hypothetical protein